jgi:hypothetical protein
MTTTPKDGGPAFPRTVRNWNDHLEALDGMTLRDWFAGQALAGFTATMGEVDEPNWELLAQDCYQAADAMIAERTAE